MSTQGYTRDNNWIASGRTFRRCRNSNNNNSNRCKNVDNILTELVKEEMNYEKEKKVEELQRKVDIIEGEQRVTEEKCNAESVTVHAMEQLIRELNNDHMRSVETAIGKMKKIKHDNYVKLNQKIRQLGERMSEHRH